MLVENFWVYQAAFWLSGVIFTIPMEKKEKPLKICGILAAVILVCGHLILWCPEGQHALVEFIWKTICCMVMAAFSR